MHVLRYLRKAIEEAGNSWAAQMTELLLNIHRQEKTEGGIVQNPEQRAAYEKHYYEILDLGFEQNKHTKYPHAAKQERTLLNRMKKYGAAHLLFMSNPCVNFDNNFSERELRGPRKRSKSSGGI